MRFWDSSAIVPLLLHQPMSERAQALRILRLHPLRSADPLQLGAALEWSGAPPSGVFVTFDEGLATSVELEGVRLG